MEHMKTIIASGLIAFATLSVGCAARPSVDLADVEDQLGASAPFDSIDERDNGKTFTVVKGTDFDITLGNTTPGVEWKVVSTTRSLGYPSPKDGTFLPPPSGAAFGNGGKQRFTWKTSSPLLQPGTTAHTVTLEYRARGNGDSAATPAAKTFTFMLEIAAATLTPPPPPPITLYAPDNGSTVTAAEGQTVAVRLPQNASTGLSWFVESVDRTLGQPAKTVEAPASSGSVTGGPIAVFSWKTKGPLDMLGSHKVRLKYSRDASSPATQQFAFTVNIVVASPSGGYACPPAQTIDCTAPTSSHYCGEDFRGFATRKCNVTYLD